MLDPLITISYLDIVVNCPVMVPAARARPCALTPERVGGHTCAVLEVSAEVRRVLEVHLLGNLGDGHAGVEKDVLCVLDGVFTNQCGCFLSGRGCNDRGQVFYG